MLAALAIVLSATAAMRGTADAQPRDASRPPTGATLYGQGAAEFRAGHFEAAADLFTRAYELEPAPELLLNIAQCYRALGRRTDAIAHLERFLAAVPAGHSLRAGAERTLDELRRAETLDRIANRPPAPRPVQPSTTPAAPTPVAPRESSSSRTWLWVTAGAVVVLGGSAAIYVATRSSGPDVDDTIRLP
jgi:Flp pilus assembly protein TadD